MPDIDHLLDPDALTESPICTLPELRALLEKLASLLVSVSTGGPEIKTVNARYKSGARVLKMNLSRLNIENPFPWEDLWEWHGYYRAETTQYHERRTLIREAKKTALDALERYEAGEGLVDEAPYSVPSAWVDIEARLAAMRTEFAQASDQDDWQDVGRRCREILIDVGKLIAQLGLAPDGDEEPKAADAKAWIETLTNKHLPGRSKQEMRKVVRDAWDLCQKVTHGDVSRIDSLIAAQATILVVRVCHELSELEARTATSDTTD